MYKKVLLTYDGSAEGRKALREGAMLARSCDASVLLLAVVDLSADVLMAESAAPGAAEHEMKAFEEILAEGVRRLEELGLSSTSRLEIGDPARKIEAVANEIGADLIVVGHRRQNALARLWSTSVTRYLMDAVNCSLLISGREVSAADAATPPSA